MARQEDSANFKEAVFLCPMPEKLNPDVVRRSVEIASEILGKSLRELDREKLREDIKKAEENLKELREQYRREFGKEP